MPVPVGTPATMLPGGAKFGVLFSNDLVVEDARAAAVLAAGPGRLKTRMPPVLLVAMLS